MRRPGAMRDPPQRPATPLYLRSSAAICVHLRYHLASGPEPPGRWQPVSLHHDFDATDGPNRPYAIPAACPAHPSASLCGVAGASCRWFHGQRSQRSTKVKRLPCTPTPPSGQQTLARSANESLLRGTLCPTCLLPPHPPPTIGPNPPSTNPPSCQQIRLPGSVMLDVVNARPICRRTTTAYAWTAPTASRPPVVPCPLDCIPPPYPYGSA